MRIAVWHDPPAGGARRAITELIHRLALRHEVDLYELNGGRFGQAMGSHRVRPIDAGPYHPQPKRRLGLYWNDWLTYQDMRDLERLEQRLAADIDASGYDVALISVLRTGEAPAALRYLKTPAAYFCHEPPRRFFELWCRPGAAPLSLYERSRRLWRRPAEATLDALVRRRDIERVRRADFVLANSRYTAGRIRTVYGRDAHVCYLGVDSAFWQPAELPTAGIGVISVGTLEAHKGFDFVIASLGRIPSERRPPLTIVGGGGHPRMPGHLRQLARSAGVSLQIRSGLSDNELAGLYQQSAVFAFGARAEPFGLVLLEAMACGLPAVAVAEGGVPEIIEESRTGHLVARDTAAFAATVDRLLTDRVTRAAMGVAARAAAVQRWSWEEAANRLEGTLERVAATPALLARAGEV